MIIVRRGRRCTAPKPCNGFRGRMQAFMTTSKRSRRLSVMPSSSKGCLFPKTSRTHVFAGVVACTDALHLACSGCPFTIQPHDKTGYNNRKNTIPKLQENKKQCSPVVRVYFANRFLWVPLFSPQRINLLAVSTYSTPVCYTCVRVCIGIDFSFLDVQCHFEFNY